MNKFKKWMIENYGQPTWELFKKGLKSKKYNGAGSLKELKKLRPRVYLIYAFDWDFKRDEIKWSSIYTAWVEYLNSEQSLLSV